jgi:zinc transporter ZupT
MIFFLLADLLHNISDGIALSSVYAINNHAGIIMALSLFTEEIFHQIADFGIWL